MGRIAGDQGQLAIWGRMQYREIAGFYDLPRADPVVKYVSAAQDVDIVAIAQGMDAAEESVAMARDYGIADRARLGGARQVGRAEQERTLGRALKHDVFETDSRD